MKNYKVAGSGTLAEGIWGDVSAAGSLEIAGSCEIENLKVSGTCHGHGNLKVQSAHFAGSVHQIGNIIFKTLHIAGSCEINGDMSGNEIHLAGHINISGNINAEKVDAGGSSGKIGAIYGEDVVLGTEYKHFFDKSIVNVDEIEATHIEIDHVCAKRVSGDEITIGPNCEIDTVEYGKKLNLSKGVKIANIIKL